MSANYKKTTRPGESLSHNPADGSYHPTKVTLLPSVVNCWQKGPFSLRGYVGSPEDRLCEPALCVESLTVRSNGEKGGKGNVKPSLFPRGLRSWRTQSAGPAIMVPTPALTAARAPRTSWPRPSTPPTADGERGSPGRSSPDPALPPLNTDSSNNPVRIIVSCSLPADPWPTSWSGLRPGSSKEARSLPTGLAFTGRDLAPFPCGFIRWAVGQHLGHGSAESFILRACSKPPH